MTEKTLPEHVAQALAKAEKIAGWLAESKATDVMVLNVHRLSSVTEAMVLATAASARQAQGLTDRLMQHLAEEKIECLGQEGYQSAAWILVDLNDVLVHIFLPDTRTFYNIEGLWAEGKPFSLPSPGK